MAEVLTRRNTPQRRRLIVDFVHARGEASVDELAREFHTSEVTIRKDLAALETNGLLLRRYGGAVPTPKEMTESAPLLSQRKKAIAREAARHIRDHNRLIIDSGSTTAALIPWLEKSTGLVVMTNSLSVANQLRMLEREPTLLMTGGTWDPHSESFQGQIAEQVLKAYDFDQLFIGADGIDLNRGTTTFNELLSLSRVMADASREVIVMAESEKAGRRIHNVELPWAAVDILVTDEELGDDAEKIIASHGVRVIRAAID